MKRLLLILLCLASLSARTQIIQYLGGPTTQIYVRGQLRVDTVIYLPLRDTTFTPSQVGAVVVKSSNNGLYLWNGLRWNSIPVGTTAWGTITGSISAQTDLMSLLGTYQPLLTPGYGIKLTGAAIAFDSAQVRKVDTMYRLNDSTISYTINGASHTVLLRGTAAGGIGSLVLNTPSALFATPVTFTNSGGAWSGNQSLNNQSSGTFFAGPTSGATTPTFRSLVTGDLPTGIPNANLQNSSISLLLGTAGSVPAFSTGAVSLGGTILLNVPTAGPTTSGFLTAADWLRFNSAVTASVISVNGQTGVVVVGSADSLMNYPIDFTNFHANWVLSVSPDSTKLVFDAPGSGSGITTLNGLNATIQHLGVGSSGTSPNWSSVTATHTLNIPIVNGADTGLMTPGMYNTLNAALSSISTANSVTGLGTVPSPVQLVGDVGSPGNSFYYGTNGSGAKGYYVLPTGVAAANPTASIGLTVVNGSATTFMRSDAAPALGQAIAPTWTNPHTFNGGIVMGNNITFSATNTYQIGTTSVVAAHVFARIFGSDAAVSLAANTGSSAGLFIGAAPGITLLSTGQAQLNNYITSTTFTGTATSVLGTDASGDVIQLPVVTLINANQGVSVDTSSTSIKLGGFFYKPDTIATLGYGFGITGLPNEATLAAGDSVLVEKTGSKYLTLVPSSAIGGGGAVSSVSNADGSLTISPTTGAVVASLNVANANTWTASQTMNNVGIHFSGNAASGNLIGDGTNNALSVNTHQVISNNQLILGVPTGQTFQFNINNVANMALLTTGQLRLNNYTASSSFPVTGVAMLVTDAAGNVGTQTISGGSQTFPQVLATGRTLAHNDSILLNLDTLRMPNGIFAPDSVNALRAIVGGTTAPAIALLWNDNFLNRTAFGANYTTAAASATYSFQADTVVNLSGGNGSFGNSILRQYWTVSETWTQQIRGKIVTIPATTAGVVFGITGTNFSTYAFFDMSSSSGNLGKILLQTTLGTTYQTSSAITPVAGDSVLLTLRTLHDTLYATYQDITQSTSVSTQFHLSDWGSGSAFKSNTGEPQLYTLGGSFNLNGWTFTNDANKNIPVLCVSHSIGHGYGAGAITARYMNDLFNSNYNLFAVEGGSSDKVIDKLNELPEILSYGAGKVVLDIGTNDANAALPLLTFQAQYTSLVVAILNAGSRVIICNIVPRNGLNVLPYNQILANIANKYGLKYVDNYTSLQGTAGNLNATYDFGDHVHINAAGHLVVAANILAADPAILNETSNYSFKVANKRSAINNPLQVNDTAAFNNVVNVNVIPNASDSSTLGVNTAWVKQALAANNAGGGFILNQTSLQSGANFNISGTGTAGFFSMNGTFTSATGGATLNPALFNQTITAGANTQVLIGLDLNPTLTVGAFTGVGTIGLRVQGGYVQIPSTDLVIGTTGDPGNYRATIVGGTGEGALLLGNATSIQQTLNGTLTAGAINSTNVALNIVTNLTATATGQKLYGLLVNPTFTPGAFAPTDLGLWVENGITLLANGMQFDVNGSNPRLTNTTSFPMNYQSGNTTTEHNFQSFASSLAVLNISGAVAPGGNTLQVMNSAGDSLLLAKGAVNTVNIGHGTFNAAAILNVFSTTQGFAMPRMTTTQQNAIASPFEGLMVYDNVLHVPAFYNGSAWTDAPTSGTYTATITTVSNCTSPSVGGCHYIRVGNQVTVDVAIAVNITLTATATEFYVSLPITSTISVGSDVVGTGTGVDPMTAGLGITGNTANHVADVTFTPTGTGSNNMFLHFMYTVD